MLFVVHLLGKLALISHCLRTLKNAAGPSFLGQTEQVGFLCRISMCHVLNSTFCTHDGQRFFFGTWLGFRKWGKKYVVVLVVV
jgi:hypothetical protein